MISVSIPNYTWFASPKVSFSFVLYKTSIFELDSTLKVLRSGGHTKNVYLIDNSPAPCISQDSVEDHTYVFTGSNLGYGRGHNIALAHAIAAGSEIHFVLNPDISFEVATIISLIDYMRANSDIGYLMPRVVYPNGDLQRLCKLFPTPWDLIVRRFGIAIARRFFANQIARYELAFWDYSSIADIPVMSGCFMVLRTSCLAHSGLFDDRYFMYMEDFDLIRRIGQHSRTVFFPQVTVTHIHSRESYRSWKMTLVHIISSIQYFNKWGWFIDPERKRINMETLSCLGYKTRSSDMTANMKRNK